MRKLRSQSRSIVDEDLLSGWKEIAAYLKCSQKTAHRREQEEDLPVLRPDESRKGPVFASKRSLNAWLKRGIESAIITDNQLIVFDKRRRILWTHEFQESLRSCRPGELEWRLKFIDLRGDGERGVLLVTQFLDSSTPDQVLYFSPEGKVQWTLEPAPQLQKPNRVAFENAWMVKHLVTVPEAAGHGIYLAMANGAGWGGCILRVNAVGRPTVHFANAGFVEHLCSVVTLGEHLMIACGENNDFDCGFVALLGIDDPPSCSVPGKRTVYRYVNAPSEMPRKYILFPKTELIAARNKPYGHAQHMQQYQDRVIVEVETGEDSHFRYHFTKYLEPMYVFPSGNHEFLHQSLERSGAIGHPWSQCPELDEPLILRVWTRVSGWQTQEIPWRDNPWREE